MNSKRSDFLMRYALPLGLLVLVVLLQLLNMNTPLFSALNIKNILLQTTSIGLIALGLSYIMISGEGDMSFAGVFSLLSVIFAEAANATNDFLISFVITVGISLFIYILLAILVTRLKLSSFISSIAVMFMANGVEKAIHQQTTLINNESIKAFSTVEFVLPLVVWIALILFVISLFIIKKTKFGFNLRIVGENKQAGLEAGLNPKSLKVAAYIIAGLMIALAAVIESTRVGAIYEQGKNYMLPVFAACYLGSSMFVPGRVNIMGTLVGALFFGIINNFMKMINVEAYVIPIVQGIILILSVGLVAFKNRENIMQIKL